jgi:nitrate reductase NapE component
MSAAWQSGPVVRVRDVFDYHVILAIATFVVVFIALMVAGMYGFDVWLHWGHR